MNDSQQKTYDVIIIGAGPAGLAAAIESSRRGLSCIVLDRNKKPGRKLYATGNGRCNICNDVYDSTVYFGNSFAEAIMNRVNLRDFTLDFIHDLGIETTCINGYYYPMSRQSSTVVWGLRDAALMSGAEISCGKEVVRVEETDCKGLRIENPLPRYMVTVSDGDVYMGSSLIIASGSPSGPECGAPESSKLNHILESLKLEYEPYRASLCPVICNEDFSMIAGVRADVIVSIPLINTNGNDGIPHTLTNTNTNTNTADNNYNQVTIQERGELQITENSLSGIVIFNLAEYIYELINKKSNNLDKNKNSNNSDKSTNSNNSDKSTNSNNSDNGSGARKIIINLMPDISETAFINCYIKLKTAFPKRKLMAFLNGFIHDKLAAFFEKKLWDKHIIESTGLCIEDMDDDIIIAIYDELTSWSVVPESLMGFDRSQASAGGIITDALNPETMAVNGRTELYAAGEAVNILGKCGGYNISFALYTGSLAGKSVLGKSGTVSGSQKGGEGSNDTN